MQRALIFIIALFSFATPVFAADSATSTPRMKAHLLVALGEKEEQGRSYYWRGAGETHGQQMRRYFDERLGALGLELVYTEKATYADLSRVLNDRTTAAVFWVSHASSGSSNGALGFEAVVPDFNGANVASLFQQVHPNLRWLALIGCNGKPILDRNKAEGYYRDNRLLKTWSSDELVIPAKEMNQATSAAYLFLSHVQARNPETVCSARPRVGRTLLLSRSESSPVSIKVGERLISLSSREESIWIPAEVPADALIEVQALDPSLPLGDFSLSENGRPSHEMHRRRDGTPMGKTKRILKPVDGSLPALVTLPPGC